jgi:hypothetical protein
MRTKHIAWLLFLLLGTLSISACGDDGGGGDPPVNDGGGTPGNDGGGTPGNDGGGTPGNDGGGTPVGDGGILPPPACGEPGATQCNNCMDDDGDGLQDGADPHCISALDDDESSFATGIPGDNRDPKQDCFFDGDSGDGNDGCSVDICCLLGDCPTGTDCNASQECVDFCAPAAPPGCDCFGCCTVCYEGTCKDILTIPDSTDGWDCDDLNNLGDDTKCPMCTKVANCGTDCDEGASNDDCVLCPGQSPDELPAECGGANECPDGLQVCSATIACPQFQYCASGCCVEIVIE